MKILKLIQNELIKILSKVSFVIIAVLFIVFSAALPFAFKGIYAMSQSSYSYENTYYFYEAQNAQEIIQTNKQQSDAEKVSYKQAQLSIQLDDIAQKLDKNFVSDWRYELFEKVAQGMTEISVIELLQDDIPLSVIEENMDMYYRGSADTENSTPIDYTQMDSDQLEQAKAELKEKNQGFIQKIQENDFVAYAKERELQSKQVWENSKEKLGAAKKLAELTPEDETVQQNLQACKFDEELTKLSYEQAKLRVEEKIPYYDDENWKNQTMQLQMSVLSEIQASTIVKEQDFYKMADLTRRYDNYDSYKKDMENRLAKLEDLRAKYEYSMEHNIPTLETEYFGTRNIIYSSCLIGVSVLCLLLVIFTGGAVSGEYSSGSIRLLLTRPARRWKILLSKYLAVIIIGLGALLAGYIASSVGGMLAFGTGGLSDTIIQVSGGAIRESNFWLSTLQTLLVSSCSMLCIITFTFMLSTITTKTAVAVGFGVFAQFVGSISGMLSQLFNWIQYTILPYLNLNLNFMTPMYYGDIINSARSTFSLPLAMAILAVHIAVALIITFVVFCKRQIKN